jgi:HPt (histidine-containing phosphotransfer) domain-containing protein
MLAETPFNQHSNDTSVSEEKGTVDLSNLYAIAGGDEAFVMALLSKMCKALPEAFANMDKHCAAQDWAALKATAHKAKSTFAYLSLHDMKNRLNEIEHASTEDRDPHRLPQMVAEANAIGKEILVQLQAALAQLM